MKTKLTSQLINDGQSLTGAVSRFGHAMSAPALMPQMPSNGLTTTSWPLPGAWLGWHIDWRSGSMSVNICGSCPDKRAAQREAQRLRCSVRWTTCPICSATETARRNGEQL